MTFVAASFDFDPDALADAAVAYLQERIPGFELAEGHLEGWLIEALARIAAEVAFVASDVPTQVFSGFGQQILGISPAEGAAATLTSTWTVLSAAGYRIPAGTVVGYRTSGDTAVLFATTADIDVPPGSTTVAGVQLTAVEPGFAGNGVPSGVQLELIDTLSYVTSVTATSTSAGGVDAETEGEYRDRLAAELQLLSPRPILPGDFAVLARRVPGVARAVGISGYNPDDETTNNERYVAVAVVDELGEPLPDAVKDAVVAYLDGLREVNFVVAAADPTYTTIDVDYSVIVATGYASADVLDAVGAVIAAELSPATWAGGPDDWRAQDTTVGLFAVAALIASVPGVARVLTVELNGSAADVVLTGAAPLPRPGTVTGTAA